MKHWFKTRWNWFKASYHWNSMEAIAARTGKPHGILMQLHAGYVKHSKKYNECIAYLRNNGQYVTALDFKKQSKT